MFYSPRDPPSSPRAYSPQLDGDGVEQPTSCIKLSEDSQHSADVLIIDRGRICGRDALKAVCELEEPAVYLSHWFGSRFDIPDRPGQSILGRLSFELAPFISATWAEG